MIHDAELFTVGPDEVVVTFRTDDDTPVTTVVGGHEATTTGPYHSARHAANASATGASSTLSKSPSGSASL